jgi:hypothetical protein
MESVESLLGPQCEPLPAATLPPVEYGREPDGSPKTAVIVCHGMGQQVRFQTLNDVVQLLREEAARRDETLTDIATRMVLMSDASGARTAQLGRAELTVGRADGSRRQVHLYEAYWAPLTEGQVSIRDVLWFLLMAGFHGTIAGLRGFRRLMFGTWVPLQKAAGTALMFVFALAVVLSLVLFNSTLALFVAGNALRVGQGPAFPNPALIAALVRDLARLEIVCLPLGLLVGLVSWRRNWALRRTRFTGHRWHLPKMLEWVMVVWVWCALIGTVVTGALVAMDLVRLRSSTAGGGTRAWMFVLVAGTAFLASYVLRFFLIQYLGDVVIYVSSYAVSKFQKIRDDIQEVGFEVGRAVYGLPQQYDRCIVVGHSLGSVVAYDLYNRMWNEGAGTNWDVQRRTALLLTFGSPLDKTAFLFRLQQSREADVREALAAAAQPTIADARNRPAAWVNIWSPRDWISGELDYYERPGEGYITNVRDPEASIPLVAHTEYWKNCELGRRLYTAL